MIDNSIFNNKKVLFHTLGCKLNFAETSSIGKQLGEEGFIKVRPGEKADLCLINTCSVTDTADHKCRQAIKRIKREHPDAIIIVTGCYAQLKPTEIAQIEGVNLVLGANEKFDLVSYLHNFQIKPNEEIHHSDILKSKSFKPACSRDGRTRYFLKVQDGCDYYCTYCTIPLARGHSRSGTIAETVEAAKEAIADGAKEIVLTGVNTGDFGRTTNESFLELVKKLDEIPEDIRFRISSIEPNLLTDDLIQFIATSKHFMPHFHIPLQSGSDQILRIMKRRYTTEFFLQKISTIKQIIPNAFIGVDVITGVRGESDELFLHAYQFISQLNISQLHVFTYSERAGTKMLEIDHSVSTKEKKERSDALHLISAKKMEEFYDAQIGKNAFVLWESRTKSNNMVGFTENYLKVEAPYQAEKINTIEQIILADWNINKTALSKKSKTT